MSAKAYFTAREVAAVLELKAPSRLVLFELANCHNESTNRCDPSVLHIVKYTGLNRKTVMSSLKNLEEIGLVISDKNLGARTKYKLDFSIESSTKNGTSSGNTDQSQNRDYTSAEIGTCPENGTSTKIGTTTSTKNGTTPVPKTVLKPITNLKVNLKDIYIGFSDKQKTIIKKTEIPSCISVDNLKRIFSHRKTINKPIHSEKALQPLLNKLAERPSQIEEALDVMEEKQWQGFNWDWINKQDKNRPQTAADVAATVHPIWGQIGN